MKLFSELEAFLLFLSIAALQQSVLSTYPEKELVESLFKNYNPHVRPVRDHDAALNVSVGLYLESLIDLNEKESTITISAWLDMMWVDEYLSWNPANYDNITFFISQAEKIWRPDAFLNSVIGDRIFHVNGSFASIISTGIVSVAPGGVTTHFCKLNMKIFPFDTQTCTIIVATWFSSANYITLTSMGMEYETDKSNEIWNIIGNKSQVLGTNDGLQMQIRFSLTIQRKPLYYIIFVLIPLLMLAFLNIMVFRVSPDSGEKISLSITILLAFAIWMTMVNDLTPQSSESIPILGIFITTLMLLSGISTAVAVYTVRIYYYDKSYPIPLWAENLARVYTLGANRAKSYLVKDFDQNEDNVPAAFSWQEVALAVDRIAFILMSIATFLLTFCCIIGFIVLEKTGTNH